MVAGPAQDQLFSLAKPGSIVVPVVASPNAPRAQRYHLRSDYFIIDVKTDMLDAKELFASVGTILPRAEARVAHEMLAGERLLERRKVVLRVGAYQAVP